MGRVPPKSPPAEAPPVAKINPRLALAGMAGHCTGWRATTAMLNEFGEEIVLPSAVGRQHIY